MLIVELPANTPNKVPFVAVKVVPTRFVFLTVSLVAPKPAPRLVRQTTAEETPALVFAIVKSRVVPIAAFEPSIVIQSAPLKLMTQLAEEPLITGETPLAGLIVTVLVALEPLFALIVNGNVSPAL